MIILGRERKEIFGVKAERHHNQNWRDQEHKNRPANDPETIVPQHLSGGQIGVQVGAVPALEYPIGKPAENQPNAAPITSPARRPTTARRPPSRQ